MPHPLTELAAALVQSLKQREHQLVLAESCTAGMAAATLAGIPGASSVLVGSAVVYQVPTKQHWLGIPAKHFEEFDVVSGETSLAMAEGILTKTPWATVAAAITGHLGPDAPIELDGVAWATVVVKLDDGQLTERTQKLRLDQDDVDALNPQQLRLQRQSEAAQQLIGLIINVLHDS